MSFKLYHLILQVPKEHSAFLYFTFESNDGLGFYSTLDHKEGDSDRHIEIQGPIEFKEEVLRLIAILKKEFRLEIILNQDYDEATPSC